MIVNGELSPELKRVSRKNYLIFSTINGFSYMCLGETMIILFAVKVEMSNFAISTLSALIYVGFVLLPLGKFLAGRIGAVRSQMTFWTIRSIFTMIIALAAPVSIYIGREIAAVMVLGSAFVFYGMRAAGVVMGQPLLGDITDAHTQNKYISDSATLYYIATMLALIMISTLLRLSDSIWMLAGVIAGGATLGIAASRFLTRVHETTRLGESARRPIWRDIRELLHNQTIRLMLGSNFSLSLATVLLSPISVLALKRGYGISDSNALYYSLGQFAASAVFSSFSPQLVRRIGPRRTAITAFVLLLLVAVMWILTPAEPSLFRLLVPFLLIGVALAFINNSMVHYFLQTVKKEKQVAASILSSVLTNTGAGLAGMVISGIIWKALTAAGIAAEQRAYFWYFLVALVILSPGLLVLRALVPLPIEKWMMKRSRYRLF